MITQKQLDARDEMINMLVNQLSLSFWHTEDRKVVFERLDKAIKKADKEAEEMK